MARKNVKGAVQFNYEVTRELAERFRKFCAGRGEPVVFHLEIALERHLANPPPVVEVPPPPPLPNIGPVSAPPARKRGRPPGSKNKRRRK